MNMSFSTTVNSASRLINDTLSSRRTNNNNQSMINSYPTRFQRILIVFGSICLVWVILGLVFGSIETFRRWKRRSKINFRLIPQLNHRQSIGENSQEENQSLNDENDDQLSVLTSFSYLSERSRRVQQTNSTSNPCSTIAEEDFHVDFKNLAFSCSTLNSTIENNSNLFSTSGACRNLAFSRSTLNSSLNESHRRNSSQSSSSTALSQMTNATFLSMNTEKTRQFEQKLRLLPTLMITDCDRLQTDVIDLNEFEPEKDWRRFRNGELRRLLNDRLPQSVR